MGGKGEVKESKKNFMFCIHIWITHKIMSILSTHTWGKNDMLPPIVC